MVNDPASTAALLEIETWIRGGSFIGVFFIMLVWEWLAPKRVLSVGRGQRWAHNLVLFGLNSIIVRLLFPAAAVGFALAAAERDFGLLNWLEWPFWIELIVAVVLLDLAIYLQHLLMHKVPLLWRLHRVHHADLDIDLTTGARFHTLEILLSMAIKWLVILLLGPAALAVLIFEVVLNAMAVFNHANVALPAGLDRRLRRFVVTPDMHRVHHSVIRFETDSNYGFNLSCWDRLFGTYRDQPGQGHQGMQIGIRQCRDPGRVNRLPGMLTLPFVEPDESTDR